MPTAAEHSELRPEKTRSPSVEMGQRMDDRSLQFARTGFLVGAILGVVLGAAVWDSWLIAAIVLATYGTVVGGVLGMASGMVSRGR